MGEAWEKAVISENGETRIFGGLLQTRKKEDWLIWVPPTLEGKILAYHHLLSGHSLGRDKLFRQLRSTYFFPGQYLKCKVFVNHCLNCKVVKGDHSRNNLQGTSRAAEFTFQIIYADLISGLPKNSLGYTDVLTIVLSLIHI